MNFGEQDQDTFEEEEEGGEKTKDDSDMMIDDMMNDLNQQTEEGQALLDETGGGKNKKRTKDDANAAPEQGRNAILVPEFEIPTGAEFGVFMNMLPHNIAGDIYEMEDPGRQADVIRNLMTNMYLSMSPADKKAVLDQVGFGRLKTMVRICNEMDELREGYEE